MKEIRAKGLPIGARRVPRPHRGINADSSHVVDRKKIIAIDAPAIRIGIRIKCGPARTRKILRVTRLCRYVIRGLDGRRFAGGIITGKSRRAATDEGVIPEMSFIIDYFILKELSITGIGIEVNADPAR